ncbi:MAG: DUF1501 domain-containing protein [Steroidobacteraceae bacterium]
MTTRRSLLRSAATLALAGATGRFGLLHAAPPEAPRFLLVFLRGGYDCLNLLVPYASSFYYESRPSIAIARPTGADLAALAAAGSLDQRATQTDAGALALDADWALSPALVATMAPLYARKELAFVPFAGTPDLTRSHFETQDDIELGQTQGAGAARDLRSGFLARLSATLSGAKPIAFTDALPVCMRGADGIPNISLKSVGKPPFDERQAEVLASLYVGHPLQAAVREGLELQAQVSTAFQQEMQAASRGAITAKGFELEAMRIGRLLRQDYGIGFIDVGGWDTHVNENPQLAANLDSLGRGIQALSQELGPQWHNTVVVVVSEFGRTFRENGNAGTDHGHGSVYWVAGGAIAGGRIAGEQQRLVAGSLFQNRDLPVLTDYRALLGGIFQRMYGLSAAQLEQVFPDAAMRDLALL